MTIEYLTRGLTNRLWRFAKLNSLARQVLNTVPRSDRRIMAAAMLGSATLLGLAVTLQLLAP